MPVYKALMTNTAVLFVLASASACAQTNEPTWHMSEHSLHSDASAKHIEIKDLNELQSMLLDQVQRDQELRTLLSKSLSHHKPHGDEETSAPEPGRDLLDALWTVDNESSDLLKAMIAKFGWPSYDMIGKEAADAAWLLAQHTDSQPEFQEQILKLMEPLVEQSQADGMRFAMLTDRVLMNKQEPQIYGTQFMMDDEGVLRPVPVEDFEHIDERRASVGLTPIKEYAAYFASIDGAKTDATPLDAYPAYNFDDSEECESDDFHNHP